MITRGEQQYFTENFVHMGLPKEIRNNFDLNISSGKRYNKLSWICINYDFGKGNLSREKAIEEITKIYNKDLAKKKMEEEENSKIKGVAKIINSLTEFEIHMAF